jgi:hypothetical protein
MTVTLLLTSRLFQSQNKLPNSLFVELKTEWLLAIIKRLSILVQISLVNKRLRHLIYIE